MEQIIVKRASGPSWVFRKNTIGQYECKKRHTYRIMFGPSDSKPIWIGQVLSDAIVTAEKAIKAEEVVFTFGRYIFNA